MMLWTGLENLEGQGDLARQEPPAGRLFWTTLGILGRSYLEGFGTCGSAKTSGRIGTIDWDWGCAEKELPNALGQPSGQGPSAGPIFSTTWGTCGKVFFDNFGQFRSVQASGMVKAINWDRGMCRKKASQNRQKYLFYIDPGDHRI